MSFIHSLNRVVRGICRLSDFSQSKTLPVLTFVPVSPQPSYEPSGDRQGILLCGHTLQLFSMTYLYKPR